MDQEIKLADPRFIPLAPEEAAEAVRLLAALIRAIPAPAANSPVSPPESISQEALADGSPPALRGRGKTAPYEDAGEGR